MNILVTGGTGFIGTALILRLRRDGHSITVLSRNVEAAVARLGKEAAVVDSGIHDAALEELVERADAIVNLAGEPIVGRRWTATQRRRLSDSRIRTTRRMVDAIKRVDNPPRVLVSASAVGFYGDGGEDPLTEDAPSGSGFLAELCQAWESEAALAAAAGVRVVTPRIGVVLGREGGALDKMLLPFLLGLGGSVGSGRQYVPWIHLHDLVELFAVALTDDRYSGPINATAPAPLPFRDFARAVGTQLRRPTIFRAPASLLRLVLGAASEVLLSGQRAIPARPQGLGFDFRFGALRDALEDLLDNSSVSVERVDQAVIPKADYFLKRRPDFVLETESDFNRSIDELFPFFSQADNLGLITPAKMRFRITSKPDVMGDGSLIAYRLRIGPMPLRWTTKIERWRPGLGFVDSQIRGPYHCWWHEHSFEEVDGGVRMHDRVLYAPPAGVLGRLVNELFIRHQLGRVFGYRASVMSLRFGTSNAPRNRASSHGQMARTERSRSLPLPIPFPSS